MLQFELFICDIKILSLYNLYKKLFEDVWLTNTKYK